MAITDPAPDVLPIRQPDALDFQFGAPITGEAEAWSSYNALKAEKKAPGTIPADRIPAMQSQLSSYVKQSRAYDRPLFPTQTREAHSKRIAHENALLAGTDDDSLKKALSPEQFASLTNRSKLAPDPDAYRARTINAQILTTAYGKPIKPEMLDQARDHYAKTVLNMSGDTSDKAVYGKLQSRKKDMDAANAIVKQASDQYFQDTAAGSVQPFEKYTSPLAAITDPDLRAGAESELRLTRRRITDLNRSVAPIAQSMFNYIVREADRTDALQIDTVATPMKDEIDAADRFTRLTDEQQSAVMGIIQARTAKMPFNPKDGLERAGEAMGNQYTNMVKGSSNLYNAIDANVTTRLNRLIDSVQGKDPGRPGSMTPPTERDATDILGSMQDRFGDPAFSNLQQDNDRLLRARTMIKNMGATANNPIKPSDSWGLKSFILGAQTLPYMIMAVSGPGTFLSATSMAGDSYSQARTLNPEADPNNQMGAALVSGATQAIIERASVKSFTSLLKGKNALVGFLTGKYGTESALRMAGITSGLARGAAAGVAGVVTTMAVEYGEEIAQDFTDRGLQDLAIVLSDQDPTTDYRALLKSWAPNGANGAPTILALLPYALIGGMGASFRHFTNGAILSKNAEALRKVGIPEDKIQSIVKSPNLVEADQHMREAFQEGLEIKERSEEDRARQLIDNDQEIVRLHMNDVEKLNEGTGIKLLYRQDDPSSKTGEIYILTLPEQESQVYETEMDAHQAFADWYYTERNKNLDAITEGLTNGMVDFLKEDYKAGQDVAVKIVDALGSINNLVKKGIISQSQAAKRLEIYALEQGLSLPELKQEVAQGRGPIVRARSYAQKMKDGSTKYFVDLFKGADPLNATEDFSENFWKQAFLESLISESTAIAWLYDLQKSTGYQYLPDNYVYEISEDGIDMNLIEGLSKASIQYLLSDMHNEQLPKGFAGWVEHMVALMGNAWTWARQLLASKEMAGAIRDGKIDKDFIRALSDSVGLNESARERRAELAAADEHRAAFLGNFPALSETIKGQLMHPETAKKRNDPLYGELQRIYDSLVTTKQVENKRTGKFRIQKFVAAAEVFFAPKGQYVNMDNVRGSLDEKGFAGMDTIGDMLSQVEDAVNGREHYATSMNSMEQGQSFSLGTTTVTPGPNTQYFPTKDGILISGATFSLSPEYGMRHRPSEDGPRAHDLSEVDMTPADVYDHPEWYSGMGKKIIAETMKQLRAVKGKADAFLTIYRAGPKGEMNTGDWVSLSKEYASTHSEAQDPENYKVWESKVKASDVRWAMDDLAEFGYFGDSTEAKESNVTFSLSAFHGTPHKVKRFSTDKIGTGEGAQAYGWGLYFASAVEVAKDYAKKLADLKKAYENVTALTKEEIQNRGWHEETDSPLGVDGLSGEQIIASAREAGYGLEFLREDLIAPIVIKWAKKQGYLSRETEQSIENVAATFNAFNLRTRSGNLYTVTLDVNDDELLDWDKPLSEQSEKLMAAFNLKIWNEDRFKITDLDEIDNILSKDATLGEAYQLMGDPKDVSLHLLAAGIPGIRYLDGNTRNNTRWVAKHPQGGENEFADQSSAEEFQKRNPEYTLIPPNQSYNYVMFDDSLITITDENGEPVAKEQGRSFSISASELKMKPPKGVTTNKTEALPTWNIPYKKGISISKTLNTKKTRDEFYARLDDALGWLRKNPEKIITASGWVKFLEKAGVYGEVPMPPTGLTEILLDPSSYVAKLDGAYHGERSLKETQSSARQGLDGTSEMRRHIGDGKAPAPFVVALHHLWGILSRMLPPIHQEGMWLRLISHRPILDAIQSSIDGTFNLSIEEWENVIQNARAETAEGAGQIGNAATANANAFHAMLVRLNGRWQDMADVYAAPNSREMGRRFWDIGAGKLGIKNKVQRFIGLTFGIPGVIMDRWKFVEFWLPTAMEGRQSATTSDYFDYGNNTPQDPVGIYGVYGTVESDNELLSLAMYEAFETVLEVAIQRSPELKSHLGNHANAGGMHWHGWNAIKNEAVGHSSLDLTKDLTEKYGVDITSETVYSTLRNGLYYTEGSDTKQSNTKLILENGTIRAERVTMARGLQSRRLAGRYGATSGGHILHRQSDERSRGKKTTGRSVLTPERFSKEASANKASHKFGTSVDVSSAKEYDGYDLILIEKDGETATISVSPTGEVGSVTKSAGATSSMVADAFKAAIETGKVKWLYGFDTILPGAYSDLGFKAMARVLFNPEFKPPGWSYETYAKYNNGKPDVVFMKYVGESQKYSPGDGQMVGSYEEAVDIVGGTTGSTFSLSMGSNESLLQPMITGNGFDSEIEISRKGAFRTYATEYSTSSFKMLRFVKIDDEDKIISALQARMNGPRSKSGVIAGIYTDDAHRRKGNAASVLRYAQETFNIRHSKDLTSDGRAFMKGDGTTFSLSRPTVGALESIIAQRMNAGPDERAKIYENMRERLLAHLYKLERREATDLTPMEENLYGWKTNPDMKPEQRERLRIEDALDAVKALVSAAPTEIRGEISIPLSRILSSGTDKTTVNAFAELIENIDDVIEKYLRREYVQAIENILEMSTPAMNESRQRKGKLTPETQILIDQIAAVTYMDAEDLSLAQIGLDGAITGVSDAIDNAKTQEERDQLEAKLAELTTQADFLHYFGNIELSDTKTLSMAKGLIVDIYKRGRYARKLIDEEQRQHLNRMRKDVLISLGLPQGADQPTYSKATDKKGKAFLKEKAKNAAFNLFDIHTLLETILPHSQFADDLSRRLILAMRGTYRRRRAIHEAFNDFLVSLGATTKRQQNTLLAKLHERTSLPVEVAEPSGFKVEKIAIEMAEKIISGEVKIDWYNYDTDDNRLASDDLVNRLNEWRQLPKRKKTAQKFIKLTRVTSRKAPVALHLSQLEMVYWLQLGAQTEYGNTLNTYGLSPKVLAQLKEQLTPEATAIMRYMRGSYDANHGDMNSVFMDLYNMPMPSIRNYAPGAFESANTAANTNGDPSGGEQSMSAMNIGATKNRRAHNARPRQVSALNMFFGHHDKTTYWIEYAELARDMRAVLMVPEIRRAIEAAHGTDVLQQVKGWIDTIDKDGANDMTARLETDNIVQSLLGAQSTIALVWNLSVPFKQMSAAFGSMWFIRPTLALPAFFRALTNPSTFAKVWNSEALQSRIYDGISPEDKELLKANGMQGKQLFRDLAALNHAGRIPMSYADAYFTTISGAIAYEYQYADAIKNKKSIADAEAIALSFMDTVVARSAQPNNTQFRSLLEINAKGFAKMLFMFKSDPRKQLAYFVSHAYLASKGQYSKSKLLEEALVQWVAYGLVFQLGTSVFQTIVRPSNPDNDDLDEIWNWKNFLGAAAAGPIEGFSFLGGIISGAIKKILGSKTYTNAFNPLDNAFNKAVSSLLSDDKFDMNSAQGILTFIGSAGSIFDKGHSLSAIPAAWKGITQITSFLDGLITSDEEEIAQANKDAKDVVSETNADTTVQIEALADQIEGSTPAEAAKITAGLDSTTRSKVKAILKKRQLDESDMSPVEKEISKLGKDARKARIEAIVKKLGTNAAEEFMARMRELKLSE